MNQSLCSLQFSVNLMFAKMVELQKRIIRIMVGIRGSHAENISGN
jgi:hypothetical protein